jgi:hypothetical protein
LGFPTGWLFTKHKDCFWGRRRIISLVNNHHQSPPPALFEDTGIDKKRKHVNELASSSTSAQRTMADEAPILEEGVEFFDLMAS